MQDDYACNRYVSGESLVTIPASIVDWLRRAAYAEIGTTAETLDTAAFSTDREAHQEWFRGPVANLREIYALLDTIGWAKTTPPLGVQIDVSEDSWTLMRILASALEFADEDANDTLRSTSEHAETPITPGADTEAERADALWSFMASVQAHTDTLAVEEATEPVLDLAA